MSLGTMLSAATSRARRGKSPWVLLGLLVTMAGGWYWLGTGGDASADAWITSLAEEGALRNTVAATGTVQAVLTVQVGSQVTGRIASLQADFNSVVRAGQVLARIDPANFDAQLDRAKADYNEAKAGIRTADAAVATQKANLEASKAAALDAIRALRRAEELGQQGVVSARDLEVAQSAQEQTAARVEQAVAQVRSMPIRLTHQVLTPHDRGDGRAQVPFHTARVPTSVP